MALKGIRGRGHRQPLPFMVRRRGAKGALRPQSDGF
jgi:hypothetical protein